MTDSSQEGSSPEVPEAAESLLQDIERAGARQLGDWFSEEYSELRTLARHLMARERKAHTLSSTALLHEACLRLLKSKTPQEFSKRSHFFATLRVAMSQVLIDHARHRSATLAGRRGRDSSDSILDRLVDSLSSKSILCSDFAEALAEMSRDQPRPATAISLYYFFGFTQPEIAEYLSVSLGTVENDMKFAKTWLRRRFEDARKS
jgi:RNA polymerase sigma factor (TIGR02999 family)